VERARTRGPFRPSGPQSSFGFGGGGGWDPTPEVPWWEQELPDGGAEGPVSDPAAEALAAALEASTRATEEHTQALRGVEGEMKRNNDIATSTLASDSYQMKKWIADELSGKFGRVINERAFTPGAGSEWRA
jgi:hypothetical protein